MMEQAKRLRSRDESRKESLRGLDVGIHDHILEQNSPCWLAITICNLHIGEAKRFRLLENASCSRDHHEFGIL